MKNLDKINEIDSNLEKINCYLNEKDSKISKNVLAKSQIILNQIESKKSFLKHKHFWDVIGVLLLVIAICLLNWEHVKFYLLYILRILVILGSNFYDFTKFYQNSCLLLNPFYVPQTRFDTKTCQFACGKTNQKYFLKKFDNKNFKNLFDKIAYDSDQPVIVENEMNDWMLSKMNFKELAEVFVSINEQVVDDHLCYFDHTLENEFESKILVLKEIIQKDLKNFSVLWENCGKTSSKKLKKLIQRPSFLPSNLELVSNSWVFVSKNMTTQFINMPASLRISLFCQLVGNSKIRITPVENCKKHCQSKSITLKAGNIFVYSDLWDVEFKPVNTNEENIAVTLLVQ